MRTILALICVGFPCVFGAMGAVAGCPQPEVAITMKTQTNPVSYDESHARWDQNVGGDMSGNTRIVLTPRAVMRDGCHLLERVDVEVINTASIRISNAYAQGSCEFYVIKAHEAKHLQVMQSFFQGVEAFKPALADELRGGTGVPIAQVALLSERLRRASGRLQAILMQQHAALQRQQVDDPRLMQAEINKCRNW